MPDAAQRRSGLESFLRSAPAAGDAGVVVTLRSGAGFLNLRGDAALAGFVDAAAGALGQPLPLEPNTFTAGSHRVYWLGPDEWLIVAEADEAPGIRAALDDALAGMHVAVNDVTGGNVALVLAGARSRDVLVKGCTLDLDPSVFGAGQCAQSGLARASILLGRIDDTPAFEIVVRRSFSDYVCRWLSHSARMYGVRFESG